MSRMSWKLTPVLLAMATIGCPAPDERFVQQAERSVEHQARQNQEIARQSREVTRQGQDIARAARDLVEADAQARRELIQAQEKLQHEIQSERASLDRQREQIGHQRDQLEQERHALAEQRQREPIIAETVRSVALLVLCILPLAVCLFVLYRLMGGESTESEALGELLVAELVAEKPKLLPVELPSRPRIECQSGDGPADAAHVSDEK